MIAMVPRLPEKVKEGLQRIIQETPYIEGFAIGGSIAAGKFKEGDDVDVDVLLLSYSQDPLALRQTLYDRFRQITEGLELQVRVPFSKETLHIPLVRVMRPQTIYVFKSEAERKGWGAPLDNTEVYFCMPMNLGKNERLK